MIKSHNRLSTFGVIGTRCVSGLSRQLFYKSQSPFGFWGDWNKVQYYAFFKAMESHNRLSAFGVIGTTMNVTLAEDEYKKSQSPFGFWGDWNNIGSDDWTIYYNVTIAFRLLGWLEQAMMKKAIANGYARVTIAFRLLGWLEQNYRTNLSLKVVKSSQSPFGFWGDWNRMDTPALRWMFSCHNRLSAFGVIGTLGGIKWSNLIMLLSQSPFGFWGDWNIVAECALSEQEYKKSQSPFGFWGDWNLSCCSKKYFHNLRHNRLSAFGVIGTSSKSIFVWIHFQ